jgi:hypothetical protein
MLPIGDQTPQNRKEWLQLILSVFLFLAFIGGIVALAIRLIVS